MENKQPKRYDKLYCQYAGIAGKAGGRPLELKVVKGQDDETAREKIDEILEEGFEYLE